MAKKSKIGNRIKIIIHLVLSVICMLPVVWGIPCQAYSSGEGISQAEATKFIRHAADATELAWEEFHAAAIRGTLASPLIQVTVEGQLHEARGLLMQARIAKRSQHYESVKGITQQIQEITQNIIRASRERKQ